MRAVRREICDLDSATVRLYNGFCNREPEAKATCCTSAGGVGAPEALEDKGKVCFRDPGAAITHGDVDGFVLRPLHCHFNFAAFGRVLCGLEVPAGERPELVLALDAIGFPYEAETTSVAARLLIGPN